MEYPLLIVVGGLDKERIFPIAPAVETILGRRDDAGFKLSDPRVSRQHASITRTDVGVTITDIGGAGGMLINGVKVTTYQLVHGDVVQIGDTILHYLAHAPADPPTLHVAPPRAAE